MDKILAYYWSLKTRDINHVTGHSSLKTVFCARTRRPLHLVVKSRYHFETARYHDHKKYQTKTKTKRYKQKLLTKKEPKSMLKSLDWLLGRLARVVDTRANLRTTQ